jgi:hemophore-related protein
LLLGYRHALRPTSVNAAGGGTVWAPISLTDHLSRTGAGTVASGTGAWLSAHPAANDAITNAGPTGNEQAIRDYFIAHPAEWQELQGIANPLRSLRQGCSTQVGAGAVARLFDAMSG